MRKEDEELFLEETMKSENNLRQGSIFIDLYKLFYIYIYNKKRRRRKVSLRNTEKQK